FDTTRLKYISSSKATSSALHLMGLTEQILFQSNISKGQNNRVLVAASLLGQVPGASGSGYLGVITFQRLTSDTTSIILAEPAFLNSAQSELAISSMSNGLLLPPGSISVKQKRQYLTNYNIQISSRTIKGTFPSKAPVQIRLIDVSGRSVFEKKNIAQRFSFDIPQATSGVYMLSITNHEGSIAYPVVLK
ncbi:MAG: T9SS type A sorting domain-containing protein, partial [Fibrobacter sp.]|nr:T9SS type A sorting domain-containing protein [Fibrobacter sp.]